MLSFARAIVTRIRQRTAQPAPAPAQWTPDQPCKQPYFTFSAKGKTWVSSERPATKAKVRNNAEGEALGLSPPILTILTWNIDFMRPLPNERMSAALSFLETYLSSSIPSGNAVVILLQEIVASDLHLIQSAPWIRQRFHITDRSPQNWASHYGTCTLIDRRLSLEDVFRVHYRSTQMGRDALFVDISLPARNQSKEHQESLTSTRPDHETLSQAPVEREAKEKILRVVNTHLESLRASPPLRPLQLSTASHFMRCSPSIHASILAGDLNAIEPFDRTLHTENRLKDAYLELGGHEDSEEAYTWGQMAGRQSRERYGCCRMDKVFFTGGGGVQLRKLERVGMGVQVAGEKKREMLRMVGGLEGGWVTDHLGVRADFEVVEQYSVI